jgi:outer membrane protein TolC
VVADASAGGRRGAFSGAADDADLRFDRGSYGVGVNLELPAERTRERNVYRSSLINLDRAIRAAQEAEDRVKLDVISALRSLRVTAEDLRIQFESIRVARRRVAAANLRQELGQGQIREVTEAEDDLVQAQDDFTRAVVDFRIAELELRRDLGVLEVDSQGLYADGLSLPELMDGPARPGNPSDRP